VTPRATNDEMTRTSFAFVRGCCGQEQALDFDAASMFTVTVWTEDHAGTGAWRRLRFGEDCLGLGGRPAMGGVRAC
jgi:hypothetical protein